MREKTEWHGEYKGVGFTIDRWPGYEYNSMRSNKWNWTFYLDLWIDRIPGNAESYWLPPVSGLNGRVSYDYYQHGVISSIDWHGGCTWYSKESGLDGTPRVIKVGCDYQHAFDIEHGDYSLDSVLYEAKAAIDSFRAMVPGYKYWCKWNGKLHDPKEVELFPDGEYACRCNDAANKPAASIAKAEAK